MCGLICVCLLLSQTGKRNFQAQKLKEKMENNQDFSNANWFSAKLSSTWMAKATHSSRMRSPQIWGFGTQKNHNQLRLCRQNLERDLCNSQMLSSSSTSTGSPSCPARGSVSSQFQAGRRTSHLPSKLKPPGPLKKALKMLFGSNSTGKRRN